MENEFPGVEEFCETLLDGFVALMLTNNKR